MTCQHCAGSGILRVWTVDTDERYDSPCHGCPAGRAWKEAMDSLTVEGL